MNKDLYQARKKTPTIIQMEATECGAVSLAIILAFYGKYISSEEAREVCDVSRDGSKAINIIKAARHYGMDAHGYNLDISELNEISVPFIVYWEFDHFLVVEGYDDKKIYLNDPSTGQRTISWSEFDKSYTGVVLSIKPNENFEESGDAEKSVFSMFLSHIGNNRVPMVFILLITFALILPEIALPLFSKVFIDNILIDQQSHLIPIVLIGITVTIFLTSGYTWIQKWYLLRFTIKLKITTSVQFISHLLRLPIRYFQQRASGAMVAISQINDKVAETLSTDFPNAAVDVIKIIIIAVVMLLLCWQLTAIILAISFANYIFLYFNHKQLANASRSNYQNQIKLIGTETNGIRIMETLKCAALEQHFFIRWAAFYTKAINSEQRLLFQEILIQIVPFLLDSMTTILILCYGAFLAIHGQIAIGTIVALLALIITFRNSNSNLFYFFVNLEKIKGDMLHLADLTKTSSDRILEQDQEVVDDLSKIKADYILEFDRVTFSYSKMEPPIFDGLSIKMRPGERIAIIGPSGSGKSSLTRLICAIYQPDSGSILINNCPFRKISKQALSQYIAYVDQSINLFSGTLRDNLTLYNSYMSDEEIEKALMTACLYEDIMRRGGLNTKVVEGGSNFSSGQIQRIEIARALLQKPKLLVLDEATAAMDPLLEEKIYNNLLAQNFSLVIIAHRLSAIRDCDAIYVLEQGKITQRGSHQELITQAGLYQKLVRFEKISKSN